jgi:threonyl-tRNA synthetase
MKIPRFQVRRLASLPDHRVIGREQHLFMQHPYSPGSIFLLPHGMRIKQTLLTFLRGLYKQYGYSEIETPILFHTKIWKCSGHWENYKADMFSIREEVDVDGADGAEEAKGEVNQLAVKPMNCPAHCLVFASQARSYKDLPIRLAEFGPLHRYPSTLNHD